MEYLKLLVKIKENLEALRSTGQMPEAVVIPPDVEMEIGENKGLVEKLLDIPVKVDIDLRGGFKIEVKVDFEF